jgi:hypothetical protein
VSTLVLIFTMFGSSAGFFVWTIRVTIQSSKQADGAMGKLAKICGRRCGRKRESRFNKGTEQENTAQRQRPGRLQRTLSLANVNKVVNADKAEKVEKRTAEHRAIAIKKIKEREKQADNRVRQRLLERRNKNGTKQNQKMKRQVKQWQVEPTDNNAAEVNQVKQQLVHIVKTKQRLNNAFNKLDLDKNGVLSKNEFIRMIELLLKTKLRRDVMDCCWQAAWGLRKHGHDDEMDAGTVAHWLEMK